MKTNLSDDLLVLVHLALLAASYGVARGLSFVLAERHFPRWLRLMSIIAIAAMASWVSYVTLHSPIQLPVYWGMAFMGEAHGASKAERRNSTASSDQASKESEEKHEKPS